MKPKTNYEPNAICSQLKLNNMVKFQKVLLILGALSSAGAVVMSIINKNFNDWALISFIMFVSSFVQLLYVDRLEKKLEEIEK